MGPYSQQRISWVSISGPWDLAGTFLEPCRNLAGTVLKSCWKPCWNFPGTFLAPCNFWNIVRTLRETVKLTLLLWIILILLCSLQTEAALLCFAFALHCAGHFVADEPRQDPYKFTVSLGSHLEFHSKLR